MVHFRAARIEARWSWLALLRRELRLEGLEVVAPELLAVRAAVMITSARSARASYT